MNVRWKSDVAASERIALERHFHLEDGEQADGATWRYHLADSTTTNIKALIRHGRVDDTAHLNRAWYRPEFAQDRARQRLLSAAAITSAASVLLFFLPVAVAPLKRALVAFPDPVASEPDVTPETTAGYDVRTDMAAGVLAVTAVGVLGLAGASLSTATAAVLGVYVCGYGVGSLLVHPADGVACVVIRTVAGLLLTTLSFLTSLVFSTPWFVGPIALVALAAISHRTDALSLPRARMRFTWDGLAAAVLVVALLSPIAISFALMAPGDFPPAFYNVDTAYVLEKVHALVRADHYPPESLSNIGVRRTYHYGVQAMTALVARGSGLRPHHALFVVVLPLLTAGLVAAAASTARRLAPALPRVLSVPLMLVFVPTLWYSVLARIGPGLFTDTALWGVVTNEGQNVGAEFMVLGAIAGIAAAPQWGWRLPALLIGSTLLVKSTAGIALFSGFVASEVWRLVATRRWLPSPQLLMTTAVFGATFVLFFFLGFESIFRVEFAWLRHLREVQERHEAAGVIADLAWLLLPVLIVWIARVKVSDTRSAPFFLMALGPFVVVNLTRIDNVGVGGGGSGDEWGLILNPVPILLHAWALSCAGSRWKGLGPVRRGAVIAAFAMMIAPVALVATRYSLTVIAHPQEGHEFVDNRSIGEALATIPTQGTVVVTNDLRHPAGNFAREDRQMQIPALFGHQAFAVNYAYEPVEERRPLQLLLQMPEWSDRILDASREHRWTHLLIRKDYAHPVSIPLKQIFENEQYVVYQF